MQNIKSKVKDNTLYLEIDLTKAGTPSKSGQSLVIASTHGNQNVDGMPGVKFGLNVYARRGE